MSSFNCAPVRKEGTNTHFAARACVISSYIIYYVQLYNSL